MRSEHERFQELMNEVGDLNELCVLSINFTRGVDACVADFFVPKELLKLKEELQNQMWEVMFEVIAEMGGKLVGVEVNSVADYLKGSEMSEKFTECIIEKGEKHLMSIVNNLPARKGLEA